MGSKTPKKPGLNSNFALLLKYLKILTRNELPEVVPGRLFIEVVRDREDGEQLAVFCVFHGVINDFFDPTIRLFIFSHQVCMLNLHNILMSYRWEYLNLVHEALKLVDGVYLVFSHNLDSIFLLVLNVDSKFDPEDINKFDLLAKDILKETMEGEALTLHNDPRQ